MNFKRVVSALVGIPFVILIMIFANIYVMDVLVGIIAAVAMYEYLHSFRSTKKAKPVIWISYASCLLIPFIHVVPNGYMGYVMGMAIPIVIFVLFSHIIFSNMKTTVKDAAVTLFGIMYIVTFFAFFAKAYGMNNGKIYIWYLILSAWGTDILAYAIGRRFGKHKFSQISPNKSIEGCVAGIFGAFLFCMVYTIVLNNCFNYTINYIIIGVMSIVLSVISQVGDFSASCIKRYTGIKDFGNLIPGHGGILDRCDSVMFISPFAFFLLMLI